MRESQAGEHAPPHPTAGVYLRVAAVLVILTVIEVSTFRRSTPCLSPRC